MAKGMRLRIALLSTTAIVLVIGSGLMLASAASPGQVQLAAGPCAGANPCNPCAATSPCNPCAAANPCNPCNPCAARAAAAPTDCIVPRLVQLAAANPCAMANPCNPCAAANPCHPCPAASPCNPCAAASPCNPCAAAGEEEPPKLTEAELIAAYDCVSPYQAAAYARSGHPAAAAYRDWTRFSRTAYPAEAHGVRFMNNYANEVARATYGRFEGHGAMPTGSVLAKDSFVVAPDGPIAVGPLFVMEKRPAGFSAAARDWSYTMIMPDGAVREDAATQEFCNHCHRRAGAADDYLMFLPLPYRVSD